MAKRLFISFFVVLSLFSAPANLLAQKKQELDSLWNNWNFRISPYFWYIGFKGTIYRPPQPSLMPQPPPPKYEIDVSFKDIRHSIKFALMLAGQYRNKHIVTRFNFTSLVLESEAITPLELVLQDNIVKLTYMAGDLGIGYRVVKNPKFEFDALLGMKFVYLKIGLKTKLAGVVPIEGERSKLWVDPVIGTNIVYRPHRKIEFVGYADFGPPFPDNVNSYQAMIGANYLFTKTFMITLGYRAYHIDFPKEEAIFNGTVKGWIMKIGFQF